MAEDDITQIGTSTRGKEILQYLIKDLKLFKDQFTVLKFAISVAIRENLPINEDVKLITSHNVNTLDKDLMLKELILEVYPGEAPYRKAQYLADAGLQFMDEKIRLEEWTLNRFIE